jgi:pantoate--beta-alanine ligase
VTTLAFSRAEFSHARASLPGPIGVVLTMGALHAGHTALLNTARAANNSVVATVFVNPLQFGPSEDLGRYPRTFDADVTRFQAAAVDLVWAPAVEDVYTHRPVRVTVAAGPLGTVLEGAVRPGHFDGVLTVVAKFFNIVRPDRAYFGEKDYQQLTLIRQMVADLDLGVEVVGVPTVRESDGLALSSRNVYLSADDRERALGLSRSLTRGVEMAGAGAAVVVAVAGAELLAAGIDPDRIDYATVRGTDLGEPPASGPARLLVAARVGSTRLIDNAAVTV